MVGYNHIILKWPCRLPYHKYLDQSEHSNLNYGSWILIKIFKIWKIFEIFLFLTYLKALKISQICPILTDRELKSSIYNGLFFKNLSFCLKIGDFASFSEILKIFWKMSKKNPNPSKIWFRPWKLDQRCLVICTISDPISRNSTQVALEWDFFLTRNC